MAAIWVAFGTGKNFMYLDINAICHALGKDRSTALPMFHSFTGCEPQLPLSSAKGRISMGGLECLRGGDGGLQQLHESPLHDCDSELQAIPVARALQTLIIYNKTSNLDSVNEARRELFSQKNRPNGKIPPTQEALLQHTLRAVYQAGNLGKPVINVSRSLQPQRALDGL
ncbi:hypothetical protein GWK47_012744 [Chionoecetes opilio]|uniref:Uncharacterized protein n=1 Tax=Chionoecetes opilio TaxID=41210 RepID=A0A8J4XVX6_CHIOP|nr:hypothetical protein GWK47_012744 [Chionoecetes opilio]